MENVSKYSTIRNSYFINRSKKDAEVLMSKYKYKGLALEMLKSIAKKGYYVDLNAKQVLMVTFRGNKKNSTFWAI